MDYFIPLAPVSAGHSITIDGVVYRTLRRDANDALQVAVASLPLPTGAATLAEQQTQTTALQLIDDLRTALADVAGDELRVNLITPFVPTSVDSGQATVTTAGTQVQLPTQAVKAVSIKAKSTNTGLIYVGDSGVTSSNGYILSAKEAVDFAIDNLNRIYVDSSVNGEGVSYLWVA